MRQRLVFVFFIATVTATVITLFQVYWVYKSYKTTESNFHSMVANTLKASIDRYELQENQLPGSLTYKKPSLSVFKKEDATDNIPDSVVKLLRNPKSKPFVVNYKRVPVNKNELPEVKLMVAHLLSQQLKKPIDIDLVNQVFRHELSKSGIDIPFKLTILKKWDKISPSQIAVLADFLNTPVVIEANFEKENNLLIAQNLGPVIFSLTLILLSAGSLFYMGYIIRKQVLMDHIKNDFINNIIHELRTPVSILKSSNEALTNFGAADDPERSARYLQINATILDKLEDNLERMLDITQYEHGVKVAQYEPLNLQELILSVVSIYDLNKGAEIKFNYQLSGPPVNTDSYILRTILANLLDNAIKYAGEKLIIRIAVISIGQCWQLHVIDNGRGIGKSDLPFIFDKFYRVQTGNLHDTKGYGLGLSYVKQLVKALNGHIAVTSTIGKGTTFTITFPFNHE